MNTKSPHIHVSLRTRSVNKDYGIIKSIISSVLGECTVSLGIFI
jgi:hypothetical protein